jgi:hypothetical protein
MQLSDTDKTNITNIYMSLVRVIEDVDNSIQIYDTT